MDHVFRAYLSKLGLPFSLIQKSDYHVLAKFVPRNLVSPEIVEVLNAIVDQSEKAKPVGQEP